MLKKLWKQKKSENDWKLKTKKNSLANVQTDEKEKSSNSQKKGVEMLKVTKLFHFTLLMMFHQTGEI